MHFLIIIIYRYLIIIETLFIIELLCKFYKDDLQDINRKVKYFLL